MIGQVEVLGCSGETQRRKVDPICHRILNHKQDQFGKIVRYKGRTEYPQGKSRLSCSLSCGGGAGRTIWHELQECNWTVIGASSFAVDLLELLNKTQGRGLTIRPKDNKIRVYADEWSGVLITIGHAPVAWYSKRQTLVTLSTAEAEYVALAEAVRYIRVRYHYVREAVLEFIGSTENLADIFTKALSTEKYTKAERKDEEVAYQVRTYRKRSLSPLTTLIAQRA